MEEEREVERQQLHAIVEQMADMQAKIDKLTNEKHGDAHQNNHPPVPMTDDGEDNYIQNNIFVEDNASSAASHQMPLDNEHGSIRNITKKLTYNMDSIRIRHHNNALNMASKRERPVMKQEAGKRERPVVKQDTSRYFLCLIVRNRVVAEGLIFSDDPNDVVGGHKLGTQYVEVFIDKVIVSDQPLIRPHGTYEVMKDAEGTFIAWPKSLLKKM